MVDNPKRWNIITMNNVYIIIHIVYFVQGRWIGINDCSRDTMRLRPRWRKVLADLLGNKARSFTVVASIAIGLFAMGMILGSQSIISQDMRESFLAIDPANILITTQPFDTEFVKSIRHIPGVWDADGVRTVSVRLMTGPNTWSTLSIKDIDFADQRVNILSPVAGKRVPGDHEILLDINKLSELNAKPGDCLQLELASGTTRQIRFVGTVQDLSIGQFFGTTFTASEQGYVNRDTMKWLEQPDNFNQLYVSVADQADNLTHVKQVADVINDHIKRSNREVYTTIAKVNNHPNFANYNALKGVLSMLGLLSVALSGFLISNTLSALLKQHQRLIGIMKAIGARNAQIIGMYMMFILFFSRSNSKRESEPSTIRSRSHACFTNHFRKAIFKSSFIISLLKTSSSSASRDLGK